MLAKISLGINLLLVVAVVFLFIRKDGNASSSGSGTGSPVAPVSSAFTDTSDIRPSVVAFVNGDSIMTRYTFFLEMKKTLETSYSHSREKLEGEIKTAQDEYNNLMTYAQSKGDQLPADEQETISNRIMELEYTIQSLRSQEEDKLSEKEMKLNEQLLKKINKFVSVYASTHQIDVVLNYQELAQVQLYGNPAYDITTDVINGLNSEYATEKGAGKE